jgi:hypothetical protein
MAGSGTRMIISDTHKFAFVHIPKCAGTTLRNALLPFDEHAARFYDKAVAPHPGLGRLDHHHIPLAVLRDHFPEDFEKLTAYRSFALVRDPFSRFPSSLHERLVQRDRRPLSVRTRDEIAREVDVVLSYLARLPSTVAITDPEYIHFSRQCDYVSLDGCQIVGHPRPVSEVDALLSDLSMIVGRPIRPEENKNQRFSHSNLFIARLQHGVTRRIEAALPGRIWKPLYRPIKRTFFALGVIRRDTDVLSALPNSNEVTAFITEFYAKDMKLFRELARGDGVRAA